LEEHVKPDWWRNIFNSIYLKTDADVVEDKQITRTEANLFTDILKLQKDDKILDLCCGQGRHSMELAEQGFTSVDGLDRSRYLIQRAKAVARKDEINVKFREGDARRLPYGTDSFDAVMILGNSFGYFETIHDDVRILKEVFRVLKPYGKVLIDITDGTFLREHFEPRSWEWIDKKHFVCRERSLSLDKQRLITREIVNHVENGVIVDQFYGERLYSKESIQELLRTAGFKETNRECPEYIADSQRNQDVGMMKKRVLISAEVRKEWTPVKVKERKDVRNVTVIMGDPRKPDMLKPLGIFDEDDFYTINQLKEALRELEQTGNYTFTYLNDHDTLIQDLVKLREKSKISFAFNLCDEGYYNEARRELNVPALLEILRIPFTGAGPQCLAHCYDKSLVRGVAKEMGIPVPNAFFVKPEDATFEFPFGFPVIIKPNLGDSSLGITQRSVVYSAEEFIGAITEVRSRVGYDKAIVVEEFLTGKELTIGIIGNPPDTYKVLPIVEEDFSLLPQGLPRICGYEAKWLPDSPYWASLRSIRAELPEETRKLIVEYSLKLFERLECQDMARFDWRLDSEGNPKLLEANPNPGWCWDGHMAKISAMKGWTYPTMLELTLQAAEQRLGIYTNGNGKKPEPAEKAEATKAEQAAGAPA
jgi:D-alanine-D-alanine ligase